ncbi:histidine kinase [Prosthecochloris sp. GSB1]|uniref:rod shape-determining protein MreD n=1 Tax=Prosthecochloris sp. GSB1 TaxID=281093 RepID=UPI000B8CB3C4|nr:rod shape-determining protein MreD [Prosthecochloris sp. GSB1]ASQ90901.1 histidine kinase [Prosthecochloris sp. GSB1]
MVKDTIVRIVLLSVLALLQQYAVSRFVVFGAFPDLLTVFIVFVALRTGQKQGMTYGFAAGLATGVLGGDIGITTLAKTLEGFVAGYFHIPEDSHASTHQKRRMFYKGVLLASLTGRAVQAASANVLALPPLWHVAYSVVLVTVFNMLIAVLAYQLFLKKILANN